MSRMVYNTVLNLFASFDYVVSGSISKSIIKKDILLNDKRIVIVDFNS